MTNQHNFECAAKTQQNEPILVIRMVRVINQPGILIKEDRSSFIKRNAMLLFVCRSFFGIPLNLILLITTL